MRRKLLLLERHRVITELVERKGQVTVAELSKTFAVSEVTVRSDLELLAQRGALVRSHGGGIRRRDNDEIPIAVKQIQRHEEKVRIAKAALQFIRDGDVIILDSGSTTAEIAQLLVTTPFKHLTVITNGLNVAMILANVTYVQVIMLGGEIRKTSFSMAGSQAELALENLHVDTLFMGVDSIDPDIGLMTPHAQEAQLNRKMIACARKVVAITDSTKFHMRSLRVICKLDQVDTLITDSELGEDVANTIIATGVQLIRT
jgi:DeoR family transcriptional regulator, aga operon transcriptional repressor